MNCDIHPKIKKFWEQQGYWVEPRFKEYTDGQEYSSMLWDVGIIGTKRIEYTIAFIVRGGRKEYYWNERIYMTNTGLVSLPNKTNKNIYSEEDMLRLIELRAFL